MSTNGNGNGAKREPFPMPRDIGRFGKVVRIIHEDGAPAGFRAARDLMLEKFEVMAKKMPPYAALKLAMEFDRHAMFCEVAAEKVRSTKDVELYQRFQSYLEGETDIAPAAGVPMVPSVIDAAGVRVRVTDPEQFPDADRVQSPGDDVDEDIHE